MADLLAQEESKKPLSIHRGQDVEGEIVSILPQEIILDLGTKSEGVIQKKDFSDEVLASLKVGDKITASVIYTENESGQVVLSLTRAISSKNPNAQKFARFQTSQKSNQVLKGKVLELNKGGLIVEIGGVRGFLPSSQVALSQAANLDEMVGKDIDVTVIEVDPNQNRLILSQKTTISEDTQKKLSALKAGDKVEGKVAAVLSFGVFVTLDDGVEGLVHVSEISWEKVEDPNTVYKVGDSLSAKVLSIDTATGRANLSVKQLEGDPFTEKSKEIVPNDVVKFTIQKVTSQGIFGTLESGLEGFIPSSKQEEGANYTVGESMSCLVETVDTQKRRINLAPFITSTAGLIYK